MGNSEPGKIRPEVLWYYRSLITAFRVAGATGYLIDELERTVADLEVLLPPG